MKSLAVGEMVERRGCLWLRKRQRKEARRVDDRKLSTARLKSTPSTSFDRAEKASETSVSAENARKTYPQT